MDVIIVTGGEAKEIAALALELQERRKPKFVPEAAFGPCTSGMKCVGGSTPSVQRSIKNPDGTMSVR